MRSCLFLGVLATFLTSLSTVSTAQSDMLGISRPVKGVAKPALPAPEAPAPAAATPMMGSGTVPLNSKLTAGDTIVIKIVEDHDPDFSTIVTDTGEVELIGLGRVYVAGRTATEAAALVATYLKQKYYHRATVEIGIKFKSVTERPRAFKVLVTGKVGRSGSQYFTAAMPLTLSEAVTNAVTNEWSKTDKVKLTRGGRNTEHDVKMMLKEGRKDLDVTLQDGDQIYVPAAGAVFKFN